MQRTRTVEEELTPGALPLWRHPEWERAFPWLVQGITGAGQEDEPFDLGLFGAQPVGAAMRRWRQLRESLGFDAAVHARQVHGARIAEHSAASWSGLLVTEGVDGHLTTACGLLLTASVADCIPLSIVDRERRAIAMVHAGWRGVAGGIGEATVQALVAGGSDPGDLVAHAGPAICGACYEVGPEVHAGANPGEVPPAGPEPIDLRAALARRLTGAGVEPKNLTVSAHCTRCGPGSFFSHRGANAERQMSVLGRRS